MAANASGTWLKVATKGGGTKPVFVSKVLGGKVFSKGQVITQSELNSHLDQMAKTLEKRGIDAKARFPGTYKQATAKAGSSSSGADMAKLAAENIQSSQRQKQAIADWNNYKSSMTGSSSAGKKKGGLSKAALSKAEKTQILLKNKKEIKERLGKRGYFDQVNRMNRLEKADRKRRKQENPNAPEFARAAKAMATKRAKQATNKTDGSKARKDRIAEIRGNIYEAARKKREQIFGSGSKGVTQKNIAKFNRTKESKRAQFLYSMYEKPVIERVMTPSGKGNRAAKAADSLAERRKRQILANGTPAQKAAIKRREAKQKKTGLPIGKGNKARRRLELLFANNDD